MNSQRVSTGEMRPRRLPEASQLQAASTGMGDSTPDLGSHDPGKFTHRRRIGVVDPGTWVALAAGMDVAFGQVGFPQGPIDLIVPNPPGGASDISARMLSAPRSAVLEQPVVIVNKPGMGGAIGTAPAAQAKAEGQTVLLALSVIAVAPEAERVFSGGAPAALALLPGQVELTTAAPSVAAAHITAGKLRLLSVSGGRRLETLPEV